MSGAAGPAGPGRSPLPCAPRPAVPLQLGGGTEPARPGVAVIDIRFPRGAAADVQEIVFRNFYTAFLSVRVQRPGPGGPRRWVTCLRDHRLMPCPHTEEGSQDYFSLHRHQVGTAGTSPADPTLCLHPRMVPGPQGPVLIPRMLSCLCPALPKQPPQGDISLMLLTSRMLCDMDQVTAVRFILRQPSPVWLHFTIEELQIFPPGQKSPQKDFPSWLSQLTPPEQPASLHGELPDPEKVSTEVQQMWVLTEVIRARQAAARIGRFDVDGCYDINLLSYT